MKVWKYLNMPMPTLLGRKANIADPDAELMASIRAKSAAFVADESDLQVSNLGISVVEGEPCGLELHSNNFVADAIVEAWKDKDTFVQFATDVCFNDFHFTGQPLNAEQLMELTFLKTLCQNQMVPTKVRAWEDAPDARNFDKQEF